MTGVVKDPRVCPAAIPYTAESEEGAAWLHRKTRPAGSVLVKHITCGAFSVSSRGWRAKLFRDRNSMAFEALTCRNCCYCEHKCVSAYISARLSTEDTEHLDLAVSLWRIFVWYYYSRGAAGHGPPWPNDQTGQRKPPISYDSVYPSRGERKAIPFLLLLVL